MSTAVTVCPGASVTTLGATTAPPVAAGLFAGGVAELDAPPPQPASSHTPQKKPIRTTGTRSKRTPINLNQKMLPGRADVVPQLRLKMLACRTALGGAACIQIGSLSLW